MRKRIIIITAVFVCVLCVLTLLFVNDPNKEIIWNEIKSTLKPKALLNYQIDTDDIQEVLLRGVALRDDTGMNSYIITDKSNMQKIIDYLNGLELVNATKDELPNMSPDAMIYFSDAYENSIGAICIYGEVFIEDKDSGKLYRSKNTRVIEGLEKIDFE